MSLGLLGETSSVSRAILTSTHLFILVDLRGGHGKGRTGKGEDRRRGTRGRGGQW